MINRHIAALSVAFMSAFAICGALRADVDARLEPAVVKSAPAASAPPEIIIPRTALGDQPLRSAPPPTARSGDPPGTSKPPTMDYPRVGGALAGVIALIFVMRALGRYLFPSATSRGQTRVVEVLSRSPLAPKQQVMLLRVGRRVIVVGESGAQMNTLCEISDPDEVAGLVGQLRDEKTATAAAFGSLFGRFNRKYDMAEDEPGESAAAAVLRDEPAGPAVASAQGELDGLRERVRLLSEQFR